MSVCAGTTREDEVGGRRVVGLDYEAYEPMVHSEFIKLCADIRERWPSVAHICVHHRLGLDANANPNCDDINAVFRSLSYTPLRWVRVGEASIAMAISSPHRLDSQQAVQHCITQLKANIPIWKKVTKPQT